MSILKRRVLLREIRQLFDRFDLVYYLAWHDTLARYRRSVLGPFWLVLGTAIGLGGLSIIWSIILKVNHSEFIPSVAIGMVIWYFLSGCVNESTSVFFRNRQLFLSMPISSALVSASLVMRQMVNLMHNFVVVIIVLLVYPEHLSVYALLSIPGFLLVALNMFLIVQFMGYLGARYRDMDPLVTALMQPMFLLSPVIFRPAQLGDSSHLLLFNPFTYWISLVRDPLMGQVPPLSTWLGVAGFCVIAGTAAAIITAGKRNRLSYWVN